MWLSKTNIPIDISKFDNNVRIWMMSSLLDNLSNLLIDEQLKKIILRIKSTLEENTYIEV